jgi:hypothetical protein
MSEPKNFRRYRYLDRQKEKRIAEEIIIQEYLNFKEESSFFPHMDYFSSDENIFVFPMGYDEDDYAGEVLSTSKGVLEVNQEGDRWIPNKDESEGEVLPGEFGRPVVNKNELRKELPQVFFHSAGHEIGQLGVKYRSALIGFQIREKP